MSLALAMAPMRSLAPRFSVFRPAASFVPMRATHGAMATGMHGYMGCESAELGPDTNCQADVQHMRHLSSKPYLETTCFGAATTTGAASTRAGSSVNMKTSEVTDNSAFTARVLGIVGGQLGFTALAASIMAQPGPVHDLALNSSSAWFLVFLFGLATVFAALETESLIWLGAFTATQSWLVGLIVMRYIDAGLGNLIGQAVTLTATDVLVLSAYVLSAKDNFNFLGAGLRVALWSLLAGSAVELLSIYSPFGLVVQTVPMQDLTLGVVGSIVFSLYLVYDLSMTRTEYAEDNRLVAASLNIYLDIINLFIDFLRVLGYF